MLQLLWLALWLCLWLPAVPPQAPAPPTLPARLLTLPKQVPTVSPSQLGPNPETLDPALNAAVDGGNTLITIEEPLLIIDENNEVQPGQAESYEVSDDGLTWTFHMRDGLKWSDGSDLTAADFEYSFKRLANPDTAAPYAETVVGMIDGYQDAIGNPDADGNTTTDPDWDALNVHASEDGKTLTVQLSYPCSYFDKLASFVATSPVQQATVEANGDAWCTEPDTYVCNGPYMITEWTPSERIVLSKNPYYVGGWDSSKIVSDTITLLLLEDSSASYAAYNSGEAQLVKDVPTDEIPSLTTSRGRRRLLPGRDHGHLLHLPERSGRALHRRPRP